MKKILAIVLLSVVALTLGPSLLHAQSQSSEGAARVSLLNGQVSTERNGSSNWAAATVNEPLMAGDSIATGPDARAEVQLDYADIIRLDSNTEVKIADLTSSRIQIQVPQGLVDYVVTQQPNARSEIDTPNVAVQPSGQGTYRIQVDSTQQSEVIVRSGQTQISTPQGSTTVGQGQMITVQGANNPQYKIDPAPGTDQWDTWNSKRNRTIADSQSWRYTNHYYQGASDLQHYGHWVDVPGYNWCWTPYVDSGWVPYRDGSWVWEPYWGWTWVSNEPWGWAPYHYGRWMFYNDDWVWWPGYVTPYYNPVWAPAYVDFFGFGYGRWNFGFGFGYGFNSIGWCPLGPSDPFYPWWGGNSFSVVNITNITNIYNNGTIINRRNGVGHGRMFYGSNLRGAMQNLNVRRAITSVSARNFAGGRIPRNGPVVSIASLRQGSIVKGTLPVVPTRNSLNPIGRIVRPPQVSRVSANTHFFTRHPVAPVGRSFTRQASAIRQMVQRPNPLVAANRTPQRFNPPSGARGLAGRPSLANDHRIVQSGRQGAAPRQTTRPGWQSFGAPNSRSARPGNQRANFGRTAPRRSFAPVRQGGQVTSWRQFSPRTSQGRAGFNSSFRPQGAARSRQNLGRGWHQFSPRTAPGQNRFSPQRVQPARPGWRQFSPRGGANYGGTRFHQRPPLQIQKPIVVPRNGRQTSSWNNNWNRGGWNRTAPSRPSWNRGPSRSWQPPRVNRGYSRPSGNWGGGRVNRSWGGGGRVNRSYGGGRVNRSWGGGGRVNRSYGGGGRSFHPSAPARSGGRGGYRH